MGQERSAGGPVNAGGSELMRFIVPGQQARWIGMDVAQYTPQRVAQVYRDACAGDLESQWEMFDLMESTWPELSKNLNQLKDGAWLLFLNGTLGVKAWCRKGEEASEEAERRAEVVEAALWGMRPRVEGNENDFEDTIRDALDARGKGLSVLEVEWEVRAQPGREPASIMAPRCTRWVHPQWYGYPRSGGPLMLKRGAGAGPGGGWEGFAEHKFVIGLANNKTGHPLGAALLHLLTFWWAASNFTSDWFLNFAQVYGQPLRWATYDPSMTVADQGKLQAMLSGMGSSAWGMFPAGTVFEMKEAAKGAGDNVHGAVLAMANKVCDLVVLRQTLTSDVSGNAGSLAQGEVHERVLDKVELGCGLWACKALQGLVRSICVLNFGDDVECPYLGLKEEDEEDPKGLSELLVNVSNAGLEPEDEALVEIGQRLGFKVRKKAPLNLGGGVPPVAEMDEPGKPEMPSAPDKPEKPDEAVTARRGAAGADVAATVADSRAKALGEVYRGAMAPFREIILSSSSREECLERLTKAYADWAPQRLAAELEDAMQICAASAGKDGK